MSYYVWSDVSWGTRNLNFVFACLVRCGLEYMEFVLFPSMSGKIWVGVHGICAVS